MRCITDFDEDLSPEQEKCLRQTSIYRLFKRERKRVSALAEEHILNGGSYGDPVILKEAQNLEVLGELVLQKTQEIKMGIK